MAPKAGEAASKEALASQLVDEILRELVVDVCVEEYRLAQLRRSRAARTPTVGGAEGLLAVPGAANGAGASPSPTKKDKDEGFFDCLVCGRSMAASRYAAHLSGCMGLSGSRRGAGRAAAVNGKAGASGASRAGSAANSDSDTGKANGIKRAATASPAPGGAPKPKKPKPTPVPIAPGVQQFQPPHTGSHPLSKTMSLPSSPLTPTSSTPSPSHSGRAIFPPPPPLVPIPTPTSAQMQSRKTLPGAVPLAPHPSNPTLAHRPPHPLAQSPARPPLSAAQLASDRPESDSESDSDLDMKPVPAPAPASAAAGPGGAQKAPRTGGGRDTAAPQKRPGGGGPAPAGGPGVAKKPGRQMAKALDSDSDDVASDGSDSD
ncbi:hypothetical protein JCM8097_002201 [Rhodosporidiobolus ruineniae]